jgi:hypothetical protein
VGDEVTFDRALVVVVEVLQGLAGGKAGVSDARLSAVRLAGRHLTLQAGDEELLVGPGLGASSLAEPPYGIVQ